MTQVTLQEAEGQLPRLIQIVQAGGEVIITSDIKPVAQIISLPESPIRKPKARFGSGKGTFRMAADCDEPLEDFKQNVPEQNVSPEEAVGSVLPQRVRKTPAKAMLGAFSSDDDIVLIDEVMELARDRRKVDGPRNFGL